MFTFLSAVFSVSWKMPRAIDSGLRESILTLSKETYSIRKIVVAFKARNLIVSKSTVANIIEKFYAKENGYAVPAQHAKNCGKPKVRSPSLMKKRNGTSVDLIPWLKIIRPGSFIHLRPQFTGLFIKIYGGKLRKKYRVHALSNAQVQQRLDRGPGFLRYIRGKNGKNLTVDEAWVYLTMLADDAMFTTSCRENERRKVGPSSGKFLIPTGSCFFCWSVQPRCAQASFHWTGCKNQQCLLHWKLPETLVLGRSPTAAPGGGTQSRLPPRLRSGPGVENDPGILKTAPCKFIPAKEWMGNSPDLAPMDFCVNGIFK